MDINEYLMNTYDPERFLRPAVVCADGFRVSVQASHGHYCTPRVDNAVFYTHVELGYPSKETPEWYEYAEDYTQLTFMQSVYHWIKTKILKQWDFLSFYPTNTIYSWVPVELVDRILVRHGGISNIFDVVLESE